MTIVVPFPGQRTPLPPLPIYRFSVDQYHRLRDAGILGNEDPVELLEGLIVVKGDSTLAPSIRVLPDRTLKAALYARVGIPVYWIVNVSEGRLEVYTDPTGPDPAPQYRQRQDFGPEATVPLLLNGQEVGRIAVRDLLPTR